MGTRLFFASIIFNVVVARATGTPRAVLVNVGEVVRLDLMVWSHPVFTCFLETPNNGTINFDDSFPQYKYNLTSSQVMCTALIGVTDENDNGLWTIYFITPNGKGNEHTVRVIIDSPNDKDLRDIEFLPKISVSGYKGAVRTIKINELEYTETESCHIKSNNDQEYTYPVLPDLAGIEWIGDVACGVKITLEENAVGNWTLFSRGIRHDRYIEQRLPFTVKVEGTPRAVLVNVGEVVRLDLMVWSHPVFTCFLETPNNGTINFDDSFPQYKYNLTSSQVMCTALIGVTDENDNGLWTIYFITPNGKGNEHTVRVIIDSPNDKDLRDIEFLPKISVSGYKGAVRTIKINELEYTETESCHIKSNNDQEYTYPVLPDLAGIEWIGDVACGVKITLEENAVGNWTLFSRGIRHDRYIEQRLPFTVKVEGTPRAVLVNVGEVVRLDLMVWSHPVFTCFLETPNNGTINFDDSFPQYKYNLTSSQVMCTALIGVTDENDNGLWTIYFITPNGKGNEHTVRVIIDSPNDKDLRDIEFLPKISFSGYKGAVRTVKINEFEYTETESCHIRSNNDQEYTYPVLPDLAGIEWIGDVACGVKITLEENAVGNWTLFSRGIRHDRYIEQRLPFTVKVEEIVEAAPSQVLIPKGRDIVVRLEQSAGNLQNTCELVPPEGLDISKISYSRQTTSAAFCEYKINEVSQLHAGVWYIQYGNSIIYRAPIDVFVHDENITVEPHVEWQRNRVVDMNIGPENAIYCKIEDPLGHVVQEKFYRCHIYLHRPEEHHAGLWTLTVGMPGKIVAKVFKVKVTLTSPAARPEVITNVQTEAAQVLLSCGLSLGNVSVRNCKFLSPSGKLLLPALGVGEDGYSFYSLDSNVTSSSCGLRIANATRSDFGIWRCTIENENYETYYGFLNLHSLTSDEITVKEEPTLLPSHYNLSVMEGTGDTIMSCTIPSSIRYCYFRHYNGSIFNVSPGVITDQLEYKGLGFEAGDCSVSFKNLQHSDSGTWSCHVGLMDPKMPEGRASFRLHVLNPYSLTNIGSFEHLTISFLNHRKPLPIEYCRFVRSDGIGFSIDDVPDWYEKTDRRQYGQCGISIRNPNLIERRNWTIVVKLQTDEREMSFTSEPLVMQYPNNGRRTPWILWMSVLIITLMVATLTLMLTSKDTKQKAGTFLRNSFRRQKTQILSVSASAQSPQQ